MPGTRRPPRPRSGSEIPSEPAAEPTPGRAVLALDALSAGAHAEQWLVDTLAGWGLRPGLGRLWIGSALDAAAAACIPTELVLEHDPVLQIVTLELHDEGRVLFGVDDWVGPVAPEGSVVRPS